MRPLTRLRSILRNLLARDRVERDLDDEMRAALDLLVDEHVRKGSHRTRLAVRRCCSLAVSSRSSSRSGTFARER